MRQEPRRGIRPASDENAASRSPPGLSPAFRLLPLGAERVRHALRESHDFTPAGTRAERVQTVNAKRYNARKIGLNRAADALAVAARGAEAATAATSCRQRRHLAQLRALDPAYDHLGDPHAPLDHDRRVAQIDQDHLHLAA